MSSKRTSLEQVLAEAPLSSFRGQDAGSRSVLEPTANSPNTASLAHCAEFEEFTAGQRGLLVGLRCSLVLNKSEPVCALKA